MTARHPCNRTTLPYIEHEFGPGDYNVKLTVTRNAEEYAFVKPLKIQPPPGFFERCRWVVIAVCLVLVGLLAWGGVKLREYWQLSFKGVLGWSGGGNTWFEEPISRRCKQFTMRLEKGVHGVNGTAVLRKDTTAELDEKYLISVTDDRNDERSDELDAIGSPSRNNLHNLKFRFRGPGL